MHTDTNYHHPEAAQYKHHYTPLDDKRRGQLLAFRLSYVGIRTLGLPSVFANCLVYKTLTGSHESEAKHANVVIAELGLQLIARPTTFPTQNSFTVEFTGHDA